MKALVAGGAGFIGSHLADALLEEGNQVVCVDDFSLGSYENIRHLNGIREFILYKGDINNREWLNHIFEHETIDYVFHLAANSDIKASAKNPEVEFKKTYSTTYQLLECMRIYEVKNIFFASTSAVYGDKAGICLKEDTPDLRPISYYGAAKLGCEALLHAYSYMNGINALVFRFPNVVGPRLTHGVIFDFIKRLSENADTLRILGDGNQTKPYLYVEDLIQGIMKYKELGVPGMSIFNFGVDTQTSVTKIADILCEEMKLKHVKYEYTGGICGWKGDVPRFQYALDKIHQTGWKASYTSDEAVRQTVKNILAGNNTAVREELC